MSRGDTMLIGAESKAGKSTFICGLMREMLKGGDFLGFKITKPLRILYTQAELRESRLLQRLKPTYDGLTVEQQEAFFVWSTRGLVTLESNKREIEMELIETHPDVLVIDPMLNFHNYNENNAQEMAQFFRYLDYIKETYDIAIIMAHHFRKATQDKNGKNPPLLEQIRGSSAMRGWAVTTIAMEGRTSSEYRELAFDTRNSDEPFKRIIKYNRSTKDFDWHDPIAQLYEWTKTYLGSLKEPPTTSKFLTAIFDSHGKLFSHNRTKIFEAKNMLLNTNLISEEIVGKKHLIHLV